MTLPSTTLRSLLTVLAAVACLAVTSTGCNEDGGTEQFQERDTTSLPDAPDATADITDPASAYLAVIAPEPGQALTINYNSDSNMIVGFYQGDMSPIPNSALSFEVISSTDDCHLAASPCVRLGAFSSVTDSEGKVVMKVSTGQTPADAVVQVSVDGQDAIEPIEVQIQSRPKESYDLVVHYEYNGARRFPTVTPVLFRDLASCDEIFRVGEMAPLRTPATQLETAFRGGDPLPVDTSGQIPDARFIALPNNATFVAVGYAELEGGKATVWGCTEVPAGTPGVGQETTVELIDTPILIAGTYKLTSNFDLLSGLPRKMNPDDSNEIGDWIDLVIQLFQDPAGLIVEQLLPLVQDAFGVEVPEGFESVIGAVLGDVLTEYAPDWFNNIFTVGGDVAEVLTSLQLEGELVIVGEPDENGLLTGANLHRYTGVSFTWRLPCVREGNNPDDCDAPTGVTFNQLGRPDLAIEGGFTGAVVDCDGSNGKCLEIDLHSMTLPYGEIVLAIIEGYVLPEFFGPDIDSIDAFFQNVLVGYLIEWYNGTEGGMMNPVAQMGCEGVGQVVENWTDWGGVANSIGEFICDTGVDYLVDLIKGTAVGLTLETMDNLQLQTPGTFVCKLTDSDNNLEYDKIGDGALSTTRCDWAIQFSWNGSDPTGLNGKFHAGRGGN